MQVVGDHADVPPRAVGPMAFERAAQITTRVQRSRARPGRWENAARAPTAPMSAHLASFPPKRYARRQGSWRRLFMRAIKAVAVLGLLAVAVISVG